MQILEIKFTNYRNLNNLSMQFSTDINFIIGENGIGKSNFLNALSRLFLSGKFQDTDFFDLNKEIQIDLKLSLSDDEIGSFDDYTDPLNPTLINLIIKQSADDVAFSVYHKETQEEISSRLLKNVFYVYYDSLRNPKNELTFEKDKGGGSFLNFLIKYFLERNGEGDKEYVDKEKLFSALTFLNNNLNEIKTVKRSNINVAIDTSDLNFLNSMFQLYDNKGIELKKSGYGVQFSLLVVFSLFERLIDITGKAKRNGRHLKKVNCILAFDEPEIHLHPFAQRALIKDLKDIAAGKDEGFNALIKELFGIETFSAQLLVVSHSDRIILGDYKNIIRLYLGDNTIKAVSGSAIGEQQLEQLKKYDKHLQKQFPYFCEALFAKKVIFVEGESELGAMEAFANILGIDLDSHGVSIINTYGGDSVNPLIRIFTIFQIECIGIKDKDVYDRKKRDGSNTAEDDQLIEAGNLVLTNFPNFEFEIVNAVDNLDTFYSYLYEWDISIVRPQQVKKVNDYIKKFNYPIAEITVDLSWADCHDTNKKKLFLLTVCSSIKNIASGAVIAEAFSKDNIPEIYKTILERIIL